MQVFLRGGQMAVLDTMRTDIMHKAAVTIQRHVRGFMVQRQTQRVRRAVIKLQVTNTAISMLSCLACVSDCLSRNKHAVNPLAAELSSSIWCPHCHVYIAMPCWCICHGRQAVNPPIAELSSEFWWQRAISARPCLCIAILKQN